jgi:hypothetical protein
MASALIQAGRFLGQIIPAMVVEEVEVSAAQITRAALALDWHALSRSHCGGYNGGGMSNGTDNIILEQLRHIRAVVDGLRFDMADIKHRMTTLEIAVANLAGSEASHYASNSMRADRTDGRLERIEKRLDLTEA